HPLPHAFSSLPPRPHPRSTLFPYTTLFRSAPDHAGERGNRREPLAERLVHDPDHLLSHVHPYLVHQCDRPDGEAELDHQPVTLIDRKSTRLNSSHLVTS